MSWHPHKADFAISGNVQPFILPPGTKERNDYLMWSCLFCLSVSYPAAEQILVWAAESHLWRHELFVQLSQGWAIRSISRRETFQQAGSSKNSFKLYYISTFLVTPKVSFLLLVSSQPCRGYLVELSGFSVEAAAQSPWLLVVGWILCHSAVPAALLWHLLPLHWSGTAWISLDLYLEYTGHPSGHPGPSSLHVNAVKYCSSNLRMLIGNIPHPV